MGRKIIRLSGFRVITRVIMIESKKAMHQHSFFDLIMITLVITLKPDKRIIFLPLLLFSLFYAGFGRSAERSLMETEGLERENI